VPPLVWAAFRFGGRGATLGLLLVTGIAVWGTARGHGPFAGETLNEPLLLLQTFMGVVAVMTLILVGVLTERQRNERESQRAREGLTDFVENAAVGALCRARWHYLVGQSNGTGLAGLPAGGVHQPPCR
jgi:two-component system, NtrC family, sensor kinase